MNTPYEDTGYVNAASKRKKRRVRIRDYGNKARSDKAKDKYLPDLLEQLKSETEKLDKTMRVTT